jgi:hypothetical protein
MKRYIPLIAASLTLAFPLAANAETTSTSRTFEHDGVRYSYTVTHKGDTRILSGVVENSGKSFHLEVRSGRVRGIVNGKAVAFSLRDVAPFKDRTEIASR